ncbi:macrolide 2'-phosphotransferase [Cohnella cholangitidis]|uniref:Phosphotransferase n=1 Tax=Cohnella cholangitidis TaxID=2598458 RepID=A0A7G5BX44_9BACL|nr:macrolide 2'-phosphotransferase [Cohnella cholangitidis]QMV41528.1 phosphotransferase [Cohnella cholangitidis]
MTANDHVEHILDLARQNGLNIDPASMELNVSGLDFLTAFGRTADGEAWVIRKPRRPDVVVSAIYERDVLKLVKEHLPVDVPDWKICTPEVIAYPRLNGTPAATINPEAKNYDWAIDPQSPPSVFVKSLAEAMAALHGVDHEAAEEAGIRVKYPREVRRSLTDKMDEIRRIFGVAEALWQRWQAWLADDSYWPPHSALIHGDLHPGHIVLDPEGRVTGLLDWTEAEVADPATDFAIYYAAFGESGLTALLEQYKQAGGKTWPRMKDHIIELMAAYPVLIASFAMKSGLEEYLVMARHALGVNEFGEELPL